MYKAPPPLRFTEKQKRELLLHWGFTFKTARRKFRQPVYHNDVEEWEKDKEGVYKNGKPYMEPSGYGEYSTIEWIDEVFWDELPKRLMPLLLK